MNILIDINHPAHVHFFRNAISHWHMEGHKTMILARNKDVTLNLLEHYGIDYTLGSDQGHGILGLGIELFARTAKMLRVSMEFNPDILLSIASPAAAWTAAILHKPHLAFDDTEAARIGKLLYLPFTHTVYTPSTFQGDLGNKQYRYHGYHELAYLHPSKFIPDANIYELLGFQKGERFFLLRLVHLGASHDLNAKGLQNNEIQQLVSMLQNHGKVVISSEKEKTNRLEGTDKVISPAHMLDLLYYADIYIGEGGTTATEAALLGTPSIFIYHFGGGNWSELEDRYGLMKVCQNINVAIEQVHRYLHTRDLKRKWAKKKEFMLADKIDVTNFIIQQVDLVVNPTKLS